MKAWVRQKKADIARKGKSKAAWFVHWRDPSQQRHSRSCGTGQSGKKIADKLAADIHSQLVNNTYTGDPTLALWATFVDEYKRIILKTKSMAHARSVEKTLSVFEQHMKLRTLSQITAKLISDFIGRRSQDRGRKPGSTLSPASLNKDLRNLKLVLTEAKEWGQLETVPKMQMLAEPTRLKAFVTAEHFAAIFATTDQMTKPDLPNISPPDYWRAVLAFAFITGWRLNEILSIRRDDVNFETNQVIARWDDSKSKRDESIFVPDSMLDLLRPVWQNFRPQPLQWPRSIRTIYNPFLKLQQLAGVHLPCEEDHQHTDFCHAYGFHDFRRAFATNNASLMSPTQLQRLMKHSDFTTTQGYINYAKVMTEKPEVFIPDVMKKGG